MTASRGWFVTYKAVPTIAKYHTHTRGHVIAIWVLGSLFTFMTNCQMLCGHMIVICNFLCQPPQKVIGETSREVANCCLAAKRTLGTDLSLRAGWKSSLPIWSVPAWISTAEIQAGTKLKILLSPSLHRGGKRRIPSSMHCWISAAEIQLCMQPQIPLFLPLYCSVQKQGREGSQAPCPPGFPNSHGILLSSLLQNSSRRQGKKNPKSSHAELRSFSLSNSLPFFCPFAFKGLPAVSQS